MCAGAAGCIHAAGRRHEEAGVKLHYAHGGTESGTDITLTRQFNPPYMLCRTLFRFSRVIRHPTRISSNITTIATTSRPSDGALAVPQLPAPACPAQLRKVMSWMIMFDTASLATLSIAAVLSLSQRHHNTGRLCACSRLVQLQHAPPQMPCTALPSFSQGATRPFL